MRSSTSSFVTVLDGSILVCVSVFAIVSGIIGLNNVRELNRKLNEVDKDLELFNDNSRDRKRGIVLLAVVFISMSGMSILDLFSKLKSTTNLKMWLEMSKRGISSLVARIYFYR